MPRRMTSPRLVGRSVELAALVASLNRAIGGEPTVVTLEGDAGIGKSRLAEAFERRARAGGARTLRGGCVGLGGDGVAYAPIVEAIRELIHDIGVDGLLGTAGHPCRAIARLIPDLQQPDAEPGDPAPDQGDLFEELFTLLRRLAFSKPLVIVLEDLHWADRSTRELVGFLSRNLRSERIALVLTVRSDDLHRRHPVVPLLGELDRLTITERITLQPLNREEVANLAESIRGTTPAATDLDSIYERSDGNPFYVEELIAHDDGGTVPTPIRIVVAARAAALSEEAQGLLRIAALVRRPYHSMLAALSDRDAGSLTTAVREAVEAGFLVPQPDDRYSFRHELVREALYDDLLPAERTELHGRLATLIEMSPAPNDAEAAFHWGMAHESSRALRATVRAAGAAFDALAFGDAMTLLLRALELWPSVPDATDIAGVSRSALLERAAEAAAATGETGEATQLAQAAAAEIDAVAEPERWLALAERLAWYQFDDGDAGAAAQTLDEARAQSGRARPSARATILASLAELRWSACDYDAMRDFAAEAVELASLDEGVAVRCRAAALHGASLAQLGNIEAGLAELREARRLSVNGPASTEDMVLNHLTQVLVLAGRHAETLEIAAPTVMRGLQRGTFRRYEVFLLANYIDALMATGARDQVETLLADPARPRRGWRATTWLLGSQVDLFLRRGELASAEEAMREYRSRTPASSSVADRLWLGRGEVMLALAKGDPELACAAVWRVIELAPEPRRDLILGRWILPIAMTAHADWVERARAMGDDDAVARARDDGERLATLVTGDALRPPAQMQSAFGAHCAAEHARLAGPSDADAWERAAKALDAVPEAWEAAHAWFRAGEASLFVRDRTRAVACLRTAWQAATDLGADPLIARIDDIARRARLAHELVPLDPAPSDVSYPTSHADANAPGSRAVRSRLSERELEVLALVAEGRSNREIGEALFITPKTASVHITHILNKLGVSSRVEAALMAARSGVVPEE